MLLAIDITSSLVQFMNSTSVSRVPRMLTQMSTVLSKFLQITVSLICIGLNRSISVDSNYCFTPFLQCGIFASTCCRAQNYVP